MTTITQTDLLEELQREAARRRASTSLLGYNLYTIPGYVPSRFHTYLCNTIDDFMSTTNSEGFDILLLSVPPQTGKEEALTNDILTTKGWKKFGEVHSGEYKYSAE